MFLLFPSDCFRISKVAVKAFVRDISLTLPQLADFQLCAVNETATQPVEMTNSGSLPLKFSS